MIIFAAFDSSTANAPPGFFTAVNAAVEYWERELVDPIAVTMVFGWGSINNQPLVANALGESLSSELSFTYAQVRQGLTSHATSANDLTAAASLSATDPTGGAQFLVTAAEARVLGLTGPGGNNADGAIGMSSSVSMAFDPFHRAVSGDFDAIGVMEHEISEVLGRIASSGQADGGGVSYDPLDLFRYASPGHLALTPGPASFSIDGSHLLLPFNDPAGGNDAGDWSPFVFGDAFGEGMRGTQLAVSPTDLTVMDVLGFTLALDPTARNDFNADGKSGFLIQNSGGVVVTGEDVHNAAAYDAVIGLGPEWTFVQDGDFLGSGSTQFLIENSAGALVDGQAMGGTETLQQIGALGPEWKFVGAGDFLGLADGDQFLIENTAGQVVVGNAITGTAAYSLVASLGSEWKFVGAGDFVGDGPSDFLIENTAGAVVVGEMVNGAAQLSVVGALGSEWKFVGTGAFLADGKDDFLIENTAGAVVAGEVVNGQMNLTLLTALGPEWHFRGTGDYTGEGHDSFLVENTAGQLVVGDFTGGQIHFTQIGGLGSEWMFH